MATDSNRNSFKKNPSKLGKFCLKPNIKTIMIYFRMKGKLLQNFYIYIYILTARRKIFFQWYNEYSYFPK